jgi:hypothetical protein
MKYLIAICLFFVATLATAAEVRVSEYNPMLAYPAQCYEMSDGDFFLWATMFNAAQEYQANQRQEPKWLEAYRTRSSYSRTSWGRYGSSISGVRESLPRRYLNPDYLAPAPLHIINPFCPPIHRSER